MPGSANLNTMIKAARRAGRSLVKDFREVENLQVSRKGAGDFVSRADTAAEEIIREILTEARPTYGWLGEESGGSDGDDPTRRWIVDPLDGTTNFLHGLPHWAVSIALEHKGKVISGVIFDAAKDELFYAEKDNGSYFNNNRVRVSKKTNLDECLFASNNIGVKSIYPKLNMRNTGCAALDLAYLGCGRLDGYFHNKINIWDVAAGKLIVEEAGGKVNDIFKFKKNNIKIRAANSNIYEKMMKKLDKF